MPNEAILHEIRQRLNYAQLFGEVIPTLRGSGRERTARCIFHEDSSPSLSVNVEEGMFYCHNPECGARGDIFTFWMRVRSLTFPEAIRELARMAGVDIDTPRPATASPETLAARNEALLAGYQPPAALLESSNGRPTTPVIDEAIVLAHYERLVMTPAALEALQEKRGLTRETVDRFKLGHDGQRYYIPVRDDEGQCVNIRRYKLGGNVRPQDKMISWRQGFGVARLFPISTLVDSQPGGTVFLMEGEMDCLLALQCGLAAVTTTGGAGTWKEPWNEYFRGRHVVICYDRDDAGRVGSLNIARQLHQVAASVKVATIPLEEPVGADFTDFIHGHGHSADDFLRLVTETAVFQMEPEDAGGRSVRQPQREAVDLHLSQASEAEHYNQAIRVPVMVSGKTMAPYLVPKEVRLGCGMPGLRMCERCPVGQRSGMLTHEIEFESNEVLQFIGIPEAQLQRQLKAKVGVPAKCGYVDIEVLRAMNVEEMQLIPEIERSEKEAPYVTRAAFYIGHGLQANRSYLMTGLTVPDPKKQLATHLIHRVVPSQSNIDSFRLTEDVVSRLKAFQPDYRRGVRGLWEKLDVIYDDLERWTRIYQRRDLMLGVDLTFCSPLTFEFQGERLVRGWVETLVIGDSRTGKTTIVARLTEHYGAGELTTGENTSLAGLIGGLHQVGTSWALQWGRIPLNDRRLIVIDEAGNLPQEQIARMSSMRSSGIAEVIKVHTERTNARTRQIWISNPRSPRPLSTFSQGVLAVKELIGAPEDIARFDLVVAASSGDVTLDTINAVRHHEDPDVYTSELCHQRVMWAWSRQTPEDVRVDWAPGATQKVLDLATSQGEEYRYATEIPLVEPNEQRVKLARLAVAAATLFFSSDETGERIVVRPEHVEFVYEYLERLYAKPSLAFKEYAGMQRRRYEISRSSEVRELLTRNENAARQMMEQEQFTQRDLAEILAYDDRQELRVAVTKLRECGFLRRQGSSFYLKTPAAIRWLRSFLSGGEGEFVGTLAESAAAAAAESDPPDQPPF